MSKILNFFRALLGSTEETRIKHHGHDVAKNARDALGPVGGGGPAAGPSGRAIERVLKQAAKGPQRPSD